MYKLVVLFALIVFAQAGPTPDNHRISRAVDDFVPILKSVSETSDDGGYSFLYEGADGSFREEKAVPMNVGKDDPYFAVTGSYRYIDVDGQKVEVHYTADEHGFVPSGTNIPEKITAAARAFHPTEH